MTTIEQVNVINDTHNIPNHSSSYGSKGLMGLRRPIETTETPTEHIQRPVEYIARPIENTATPLDDIYRHREIVHRPVMTNEINIEVAEKSNYTAIPVALITRYEAKPLEVQVEKEVPAAVLANKEAGNKSSEGSSVTSYDSDKEKNSPKEIKKVNIDLREEGDKKKEVENVNKGEEGEVVGVVEVQGFGARGYYMSQGEIVFRILDVKFRKNAKVDAKNKPYFKFRLGTNSKKTKSVDLKGEEIKVKYTNQDQVRIKAKGKGKLIDNTFASTKVSIVEAVMEGRQALWVPLLKGDDVVGEMHLDIEFLPRK